MGKGRHQPTSQPKFRMILARTNTRSDMTTTAVSVQTKVATIITTLSSSLGLDFKVGEGIFCRPCRLRCLAWHGNFKQRMRRRSDREFFQSPGHHCTTWKACMPRLFDRPAGEAQQNREPGIYVHRLARLQ